MPSATAAGGYPGSTISCGSAEAFGEPVHGLTASGGIGTGYIAGDRNRNVTLVRAEETPAGTAKPQLINAFNPGVTKGD